MTRVVQALWFLERAVWRGLVWLLFASTLMFALHIYESGLL